VINLVWAGNNIILFVAVREPSIFGYQWLWNWWGHRSACYGYSQTVWLQNSEMFSL